MNSILVVEPKGRAVRREQEFDMEETIQTRLTRVESDVKHVIEIVTDVKVELRRTNDKIDGIHKKLTDKIESVNKTLTDKFDGANKTLTEKIDGANKTLTEKIDGVNKTLTEKI